jgi:hypothetical protein
MASACFELKKSKGQFMWNLKAKNGKVVLTSERYKTRRAAQAGIASVKKNCGQDGCYLRKTTPSGNYRFNLVATNGQVVGASQNYASYSGRNAGIASVKKNAKRAKVEDLT